jgi:hypothetical protein
VTAPRPAALLNFRREVPTHRGTATGNLVLSGVPDGGFVTVVGELMDPRHSEALGSWRPAMNRVTTTPATNTTSTMSMVIWAL